MLTEGGERDGVGGDGGTEAQRGGVGGDGGEAGRGRRRRRARAGAPARSRSRRRRHRRATTSRGRLRRRVRAGPPARARVGALAEATRGRRESGELREEAEERESGRAGGKVKIALTVAWGGKTRCC